MRYDHLPATGGVREQSRKVKRFAVEHQVLAVVAQVEFESICESGTSYLSLKRVGPGAFNVGFIAPTCTALPC